MALLSFWKTETVGNDFVLILMEEGMDLPSLARDLCDRHFGIGSDGLLALRRADGPEFQVDMRMFNPDGSEDFCGNGLRCAASFASGQGWAGAEFAIRQHGVVCPVGVLADGRAWATLPPASFVPSEIPFLGEGESRVAGVLGTPVTTGSTHFVAFVDALPDDEAFLSLSPLIENDPLFPERTSIMWTQVLSDRRLKLRIWERGVGETLGCGTGSSAAAVVWARMRGLSGEFVIENPGGEALVSLERWDGPITSTSRPTRPFSGAIERP